RWQWPESSGQLRDDLFKPSAVRALDEHAIAGTCPLAHPGGRGCVVGDDVGVGCGSEDAAEVTVDDCYLFERLRSNLTDVAVRVAGSRAQLTHVTEHRQQLSIAGTFAHGRKRRQHRLGARVVSVVDNC